MGHLQNLITPIQSNLKFGHLAFQSLSGWRIANFLSIKVLSHRNLYCWQECGFYFPYE
jgi:hypothetical protein